MRALFLSVLGTTLWLTSALPAAALSTATLASGSSGEPATSPAAGGRIGWHGETLPEGLVRAETEGEYLWQRDGAIMVYVPAGAFTMGSDDGPTDERPAHRVELDAFYIDKHEVSWGRWKRSGLAYNEKRRTRDEEPHSPDWGIQDDLPVVNVSWPWAVKFADWAGKQLPTEAQWEKAARGTDGREHPWGDEPPDFERAVWRYHPVAAESPAPVECCAAGASPYGALNMAGNVYEWCRDVYEADFYARSPQREPVAEGPGRYRVLRGGAFLLEEEDLRSALRYRLFPQDRGGYIGFRTVLPAGN